MVPQATSLARETFIATYQHFDDSRQVTTVNGNIYVPKEMDQLSLKPMLKEEK